MILPFYPHFPQKSYPCPLFPTFSTMKKMWITVDNLAETNNKHGFNGTYPVENFFWKKNIVEKC